MMLFHNVYILIGEKPGLVVRAEGSRPRGRGFESSGILDGCKWYYIFNEKGNKGSQMGQTKKKNFKMFIFYFKNYVFFSIKFCLLFLLDSRYGVCNWLAQREKVQFVQRSFFKRDVSGPLTNFRNLIVRQKI